MVEKTAILATLGIHPREIAGTDAAWVTLAALLPIRESLIEIRIILI
jgi:hypothetical protein